MTTPVIVLGGNGPELAARRCQAHAGFLARLRAAGGEPATVLAQAADPRASLATLRAFALVVPGDGDQPARYIPSRTARDAVFGEAGDGGWPKPVMARHAKRARHTAGALFRFPLARESTDPTAGTQPDGTQLDGTQPDGTQPDGTEPDGTPGQELTVFITDWSPVPAAAALAVHPAHPLGIDLDGRRAGFTGRYCRHPLTGDLLPIWTADWVKPEFGTGAVLINPGHDGTDLAFAREVGLPIRFALAASTDSSPTHWPRPPVVRSGVAIRTGAADGLAAEEASAVYFDLLCQRGFAERYTDHGVGTFPVGPQFEQSALLTVCSAQPAERLELVASTAVLDTDLLAVRLLLAEPDRPWAGQPAVGVTVVGGVTGTLPAELDPLAAGLALLTGSAPADTLAIKPPLVESAQRFVQTHAGLEAAVVEQSDAAAAEQSARTAAAVRRLLLAGDLKQAFTQLYRWQKELAKADPLPETALLRYQAVAAVLAGTGSRYPADRLAEVWQQL